MKIRSYTLHLSVALHCALLGPLACGDKSDDTDAASMTDASTTGGTTTATADPTTTSATADTTTTNATSDSTTTADPTTESAPTTGPGATSTGSSTTGDPPSAVCESFCATHDMCCTREEACEFDAACIETCEEDLRKAELLSENCRVLHEDVYTCAATDCTTFIGSNGECADKQEATWNDPSCVAPLEPECVAVCAKADECGFLDEDAGTTECEEGCSEQILIWQSAGRLCEQAGREYFMCLPGLTCEQLLDEKGCDHPPENCD